MGEHLADVLLKAAEVMHWLGKYTEANALILLSRLARVGNLRELDDLDNYVTGVEAAALTGSASDGK